ncbi:MAG: NYN domain-containing protein [Candidatus Omnitrophica bacterium]|nr:NYN domain-containing protein [Candidatus Omnitrophota bacterium]
MIEELKMLLEGQVRVYIDYGNAHKWSNRLGWHIDQKRIYQFLSSFDNITNIGLYDGTLQGDARSEQSIKDAEQRGYRVRTKPVKIMHISINASSISTTSPDLLKEFIRMALLRELDIKTIEFLNARLKELNQRGVYYVEERKCNFDVEIGSDMLLDLERGGTDCFVLWSGDSDFQHPIKELLLKSKKVILFATARRVATELDELRKIGLLIFDIAKIREFICWPRELAVGKAKGTP